MPDGRFLSKTVSNDWELNHVPLGAHLLFMMCIPHLDVEGRLPGHPAEVKGKVPIRDEITVDLVDEYLEALAAAELVIWYDVGGRPCLEFPGFDSNQKGLRKEREAPSRIPSPKVKGARKITSVLRVYSGSNPESETADSPTPAPESTPELVRSYSGSTPAQVQVQVQEEVEVEVQENLKHPAVPTSRDGPIVAPEQRDGLQPDRTATARDRAQEIIRRVFHLGLDLVEVGKYRENIELAMARWDRAVRKGQDPSELNAELELVRTVNNFDPGEPITTSVYFGKDRHETRLLCKHERLKRLPPASGLPAVELRNVPPARASA